MVELREQGWIEELSLGLNDSEYVLKFLRHYPAGTFDNIMMAGCFNLIDQDGLEVLQECQQMGVRVANVGVFASGLLWGGDHYKYSAVPPDVLAKANKWSDLAARYDVGLAQVALAFALLPEIVERAGFGSLSADEVAANVKLWGREVSVALWAEAKAAGLIAEGVPIPS